MRPILGIQYPDCNPRPQSRIPGDTQRNESRYTAPMRKPSLSRLEPHLVPVVEELEDLLTLHGHTLADAERLARMPKKYLYKLLRGYQDLKVKHLYLVLEATEIPITELWRRLLKRAEPVTPPELPIDQLRPLLEQLINHALDAREALRQERPPALQAATPKAPPEQTGKKGRK